MEPTLQAIKKMRQEMKVGFGECNVQNKALKADLEVIGKWQKERQIFEKKLNG